MACRKLTLALALLLATPADFLRVPAQLERFVPPSPGAAFDALNTAVYAADRERDSLLARLRETVVGGDALSSLSPGSFALKPEVSTIVLTGATDGLGKAAASFLSAQGFPVVLCARDTAKGERVELFGQSLQDSTHFLFTPEEVGGHALCSQSWSGECARNSSSSSSSKRRRDAVANSAAETDVHPCLRHARNVRRLRGTQPACDAQLVALSLLSCPLRCGPQIRLDGMIYFKQTASVPLRTERKRTCPSHIRTH